MKYVEASPTERRLQEIVNNGFGVYYFRSRSKQDRVLLELAVKQLASTKKVSCKTERVSIPGVIQPVLRVVLGVEMPIPAVQKTYTIDQEG